LHLYDIENDPFEKNDLASERPELRDRLFGKLMGWLSVNVEQRYWPKINPKYNPKKEVRKTAFVDLFSSYLEKKDETSTYH
ncbi:MAG: hypothetical protein WBG48_00110, partial [Pricia sp.]